MKLRYNIQFCFLFILITCFSESSAQYSSKHNFQIQEAIKDCDEVLSLGVEGNCDAVKDIVETCGGKVINTFSNFSTVIIPCDELDELSACSAVKNIMGSNNHAIQLLDKSREKTNVLPVHEGRFPLPNAIKGEGVIVGIIDHPSFYFEHGNFLNEDSTASRVLYYWDQLRNYDGINKFGNGVIWNQDELFNLRSDDTWNMRDGHHTKVAGVATGNGNVNPLFVGYAPESDIISVAVDFNNFDFNFLNAIKFIYDVADSLDRPCVINSSVGSLLGSRDGLDVWSQQIDSMIRAKPGRSFVQAAGNSGHVAIHAKWDVIENDTVTCWYNYDQFRGEDEDFQMVYYMDSTWKESLQFQWRLIDNTDSKTIVSESEPYVMTDYVDGFHEIQFFDSNNDLLGTANSYFNEFSSVLEIGVQPLFGEEDLYHWELMVTGDGVLDTWSDRSLTRLAALIRINSVPDDYRYKKHYFDPNREGTIVTGWNCLESVISVANYGNRAVVTPYPSGTKTFSGITVNDLYYTSSRGPTRTGILKPDISAPGAMTYSPTTAQEVRAVLESSNTRLVHLDTFHAVNAGTSIAAPVVTGAVALYLQLYPDADWQTIKNDLLESAYVDEFVLQEAYGPLPNNRWGYGKVDVFSFVTKSITFGCKDVLALNYDSLAITQDNSICEYKSGCTDPIALNYDSEAVIADNGTCTYKVGCLDSRALNYDETAIINDLDICIYKTGCLDTRALNYDETVVINDLDSCIYREGCTDSTSLNYDSEAITNDGSCIYPTFENGYYIDLGSNLVTDQIEVYFRPEVENGKKLTVELINPIGQVLYQNEFDKTNQNFNIPTLNLASGIYYLRFREDKSKILSQIINKY